MRHSECAFCRTGGVVAVILLGILSAGCSLTAASNRLERSRLLAERASLQLLQTQLADPNFAPGANDVYVFVSESLINAVLAGAAGTRLPVPNRPDAVIEIKSLKYRPEDASGTLDAVAEARNTRTGATLSVRTLTRLRVVLGADGNPRLQADIEDVAPVFSWRCVRLPVLGLARAIARVAIGEWSRNSLSFPLPVEQIVDVGFPGRNETLTQNFIEAEVSLSVTQPKLMRQFRILHRGPWFLRDGLHAFAKFELVPQ